jgi:hypothetical protein
MSSLSLNLFQPLLQGSVPLGDVTPIYGPTWRRSIARRGGFKIGTVNLTTADLTPGEMGDLFRYGLMREIQEQCGGAMTWQGFLSRMEWTHKGDVYSIDLTQMFNTRRALYRRLFDNLLTNGSAESGAWSAWRSATVTQSTEWVADGQYSCKIVSNGAVLSGAIIQTVAITAGVAYTFSARMRILSGTWAVLTDAPHVGSTFESNGAAGDVIATFTIPDTNTYTGNVDIQVWSRSSGGGGTCYVDGAVFKAADQAADTGWQSDTWSQQVYGRKELIELWGGMSHAAANARVLSDLTLSAWPQPDVPTSGSTRQLAVDPGEDKITLVFSGYFATLNWLHTLITSGGTASNLVSTLSGYQSEYILPGAIVTNSLAVSIEDSNPLRVGDVLKEICDSGDAAGNRWAIGVYAYRQLIYEPVSNDLAYHLHNGRLIHVSGAEMLPALARPGWAQVDDMPPSPRPVVGGKQDLRWRYLEEIEMQPPDSAHPDYWLTYSRDDNS